MPDPGGEFEYGKVLVLLTDEASALSKAWAPSDFPEFAFSEIEHRGLIDSKAYLIFHLIEPSRDNVLRAIYKLRARAEVCVAEVSGIETFNLLKLEAELIRSDYFNRFVKPIDNDALLKDVQIHKYYGTFGGYVVIMFHSNAEDVVGEEIVAGITINYADSRRILVWKDGSFYSLQESYENRFLTEQDIRLIADAQNI
ncbi:MAG: hypothetical protein LBU70_02260 [Chitinispirillales bacterium]|nr:hypothetical protein [Chitinispirillales bacterium]